MKIKYTIIFLIMILALNDVFANCTITPASVESGSISCSPCNNETKICNCVINDNIEVVQYALGVFFYASDNCEEYEINLLANNKNLIFKSDITMGSINWNLIIRGTSKIYIDKITSIDVNLSNIIIEPNANLKIYNNSDYFVSSPISINFYAKDIVVNQNSILEINLKTNDGKNGKDEEHEGDEDSSRGISSGDLVFKLGKLINYGDSEITLITGDGGKGGQPHSEDTTTERQGLPGGSSGFLSADIRNIENTENLIINLNTGNGGNGSHSPKDDATDDSFNGGNGGDAGSVQINKINNFYNSGVLKISAIAGNGGWAGTSRYSGTNDCDWGTVTFGVFSDEQDNHGDSGNGGSISDLNISTLINKSNNFEIYMKAGELGKRNVADGTCTQYQLDKPFGKPGVLGNVNIGFLENYVQGINITSKLNFSMADYQLAATAQANDSTDDGGESGDTGYMRKLDDLGIKVTNVNINYLKNGSSLPKIIDIKNPQENILFDNFINITGCYIQPTQLDYEFNGATGIYASNIDFLRTVVPDYVGLTYRFCPHCEVMPLDDTQNRYTRDYSLYSNTNGIVNIGDLNIHYSNPLDQSIYYTKRTDDKQLPVYTNKNPISGEWNPKINSYEYKIKPEDLNYYSHTPEEDIDLLNQEDNLFCYGQEYIINGKINAGAIKPFNFPFVPLRELFTE